MNIKKYNIKAILAKNKDFKRLYDSYKIFKNKFFASAILRKYFASNEIIKVHLGCGPNFLNGWLNFDYAPVIKNVVHFDARNYIPLNNNCVDYVFCEHMIEHIPPREGIKMLKECARILKPNGVMRLSTPDILKITSLLTCRSNFNSSYIGWSSANFLEDLPVWPEYVVSNFFRDWGHEVLYGEAQLTELARAAGFNSIKICKINESMHNELRGLENEGRMPVGFLEFESMILECTK